MKNVSIREDKFNNKFESKHLLNDEQIKLGSFYTPERIVDKVHQLIADYKTHPRAVIFDNAAGAGAFIRDEEPNPYKVVEFDPIVGEFLKTKLPRKNVFIGNAISGVSRRKYQIANSDFLIQIGNPPYNDTTSAYRNGEKGSNICDADLFDRDLGVSFLKSYNKLQSDVVCVLHPLSYLIKEANFKRLKEFSQNYKLKKGILFSSLLFSNVSSTGFPIVIALYEKKAKGMEYEDIKQFPFSILDSKKVFRLDDYTYVDSFIRKYPPKKTDIPVSDIGIYYYTFRDINSLTRNQGFHTQANSNSIVVHLKDFYKYAYIFAFKKLFHPEKRWLYGNLSPLGSSQMIEKNKKLFVKYALLSEKKIFSHMENRIKNQILNFYSIKKREMKDTQKIKKSVSRLVQPIIF